MATPLRPEKWIPRSYREAQEELGDAIADHIRNRGLTAASISELYPSIRAAHLQALKRGEGEILGMKMLYGLAEAVGLKTNLRISA